MVKINCDAGLSIGSLKIKAGAIIHDDSSPVVVSETWTWSGCYPPDVAEAMSIFSGIQLAIQLGMANSIAHLLAKLPLTIHD
uniref:RNase H type-1 domain-containing protein n=1 Tax=Cannabis sativa TaxID=3483 RepID=A0A803Q453_CANSA